MAMCEEIRKAARGSGTLTVNAVFEAVRESFGIELGSREARRVVEFAKLNRKKEFVWTSPKPFRRKIDIGKSIAIEPRIERIKQEIKEKETVRLDAENLLNALYVTPGLWQSSHSERIHIYKRAESWILAGVNTLKVERTSTLVALNGTHEKDGKAAMRRIIESIRASVKLSSSLLSSFEELAAKRRNNQLPCDLSSWQHFFDNVKWRPRKQGFTEWRHVTHQDAFDAYDGFMHLRGPKEYISSEDVIFGHSVALNIEQLLNDLRGPRSAWPSLEMVFKVYLKATVLLPKIAAVTALHVAMNEPDRENIEVALHRLLVAVRASLLRYVKRKSGTIDWCPDPPSMYEKGYSKKSY
jgi:hypothetical protein